MAGQPKKRVQFMDLTYIYSAWSETLQANNWRPPLKKRIAPYHGTKETQVKHTSKEPTNPWSVLTGLHRPKSATVKKRNSLKLNSEQLTNTCNNLTPTDKHVYAEHPLSKESKSRPKSAVQLKSEMVNNVRFSTERISSISSIGDCPKLRPKSEIHGKRPSKEHDDRLTTETGNCPKLVSQEIRPFPSPINGKRSSNSNVSLKRPDSAKPSRALPTRPRSSLRRPLSATSSRLFQPISCQVTGPHSSLALQPSWDGFEEKPSSGGATGNQCLERGRNVHNNVSHSDIQDTHTSKFGVTMDTIYSHKPGVTVWRLSKRKLQLEQDANLGFFHEGDCYLVMWVGETGLKKTQRTLHCWRGQQANHKDWMILEKKTVEVEGVIGRIPILTHERQGSESVSFLHLFPEGVCYLEDKSSPSVAKTAIYSKRLYHITNRKYPRAQCMTAHANHLNSDSAYLLDGFPRMYLWLGSSADYDLKTKALQLARRIRDMQRQGRARIVVVDETDAKSHNLLLKKLRRGPVNSHTSGMELTVTSHRKLPSVPKIETPTNQQTLYRVTCVNEKTELSEIARTPLRGELLSSEGVFLLDGGCSSPLTVWVGGETSDSQSESAIQEAVSYTARKGYPATNSVIRLLEGFEPSFFTRSFISWRTKPSHHTSLRKTFSAGTVGKRLFARRDNRTVGKTNLTWPGETQNLDEEDTTLKIWRLVGDELLLLTSDQHGIFLDSSCYIILHETEGSCRPPVLYYWIGNRSLEADKERIQSKVWEIDDDLNNRAVLIQVLDGKEPSHFLGLIKRTMMVYRDKDVLDNGNACRIQMFSTEEVLDSNIRVTQVPVDASYLRSNTAVLLVSEPKNYLWYGRECGGYERDYSKMLLAFVQPNRKYNFVVELEGKESPLFWEAVGGQTSNLETDKPKQDSICWQNLTRRNPVLLHYHPTPSSFQEIPDFNQEDLTADAIFILDSFDQIILWVGCEVNAFTKSDLNQITQTYIKDDPAGRQYGDLSVWFVKQYHEPDSFLKYFRDWARSFNIGKERMESLRSSIRQENANLDKNEKFILSTSSRLITNFSQKSAVIDQQESHAQRASVI